MIKLYHGSNVEIDSIDLTKSKSGKDFGKGFYLNPDFSQALDWAKSRVDFLSYGQPFVATFIFDLESAIKAGLNIKIFEGYSPEWAKFVVANRRNRNVEPIHDFDIVIGPIADDSVGQQIRRYMENYISLEDLVKEITFYGNKAIQYLFATERATSYLEKQL